MKRENLPAGNDRINAVSNLNVPMNQNHPLPDVTPYADPLSRDFPQDVATFTLCTALGSVSSDPLRDAYNVLDGTTRQKVLSVACSLSGVVEIGLQDRRVRLNTPTGELIAQEEYDGQDTPAPPIPAVPPDALLDAGTSARVPGPPSDPPVRWVVVSGVLTAYTEEEAFFLTGQDGVPLRDIGCIAQGRDGTVWIGGADGAARLQAGVWRYFGGRRWLPDNRVNAIAIDTQGRAWIGTDAGLACIAAVPLTLENKARYYEAVTQARHNRDGFVTECLLTPATNANHNTDASAILPSLASAVASGDRQGFFWEASDNDGLWTSLYVCAECCRWAVTGEEDARSLARQSMKAMLSLLHWTGIEGFPARAIARRGENVSLSEPAANWTVSPLDPDMLVKGDTSSDEIAGHYLAWFVYHRLAADEAEKTLIAKACRAVTDHILDHDYTLMGPGGKRTSWGVWTPEVLNDDPEWAGERGLGSLEILSHLRVALHLCPCERYEQAYQSLVTRHHFALNTVRQKVLPPDGEDNHSDDELAACAYYPLLLLEPDPRLRALYLLSLERTHAILRPGRSPFHNVIYQACTGRMCDVQAVVAWLREAPLDLRDWAMTNTWRSDITLREERDRFGKLQTVQPLPPSEIGVMKWNRNPFLADWPGEGTREMDGAFWLLPYWMGRYYGVLSA